jgi:hypothetical protein
MSQSPLYGIRLALIGLAGLLIPQTSLADLVRLPFKPSNFAQPLLINNPFFTLQPNTTQVFDSKSNDGCEVDVMTITNDTRMLAGVTARTVHDVVFQDAKCNGSRTKIEEDTLDYYAQDNERNVWYMGEISKDCTAGSCTMNDGSWLAGQDIFHIGENAQPGVQMLAHPTPGNQYRQEFYRGHAEDQAIVTNVHVTVQLTFPNALPPRIFTDCIKTKEFTALEPDTAGFKYYAPKVGLVLETEQPGNLRSERVRS